ncbi:hypothetical protein BLA39750_01169 [Burkholderia lata]|uniref:Uncharacterized protein n=1 Tax=Burkholderia lata (strain ATCC 17760 / DSM 23089 / LMG 22485 / NCIMB 9086 / R18194 / 383) TaxID=482957 RepID=A0A6P2UTH7_BURL3|nr:hypothetical protein [Burkholderia lata]VWC80603.1 hypothetical protein BLA39750_01169 [Burkholderia lata]
MSKVHFHRDPVFPSCMLPVDAYHDIDAVLQLLTEIATSGEQRHIAMLRQLAAGFPLLAGTRCGYLEVTAKQIEESELSFGDKQELALALLAPCAVVSSVDPVLIVGDEFNCLSPEKQVVVATHEFVHLEQVARGDLLLLDDGRQMWEGVDYGDLAAVNSAVHKGDLGVTFRYLSFPWEREAFRRSEGEDSYWDKLRTCGLLILVEEYVEPDLSQDLRKDLAGAVGTLISHVVGHPKPPVEPIESPVGNLVAAVASSIGYELTTSEGWHLWKMVHHFVSTKRPEAATGPEDARRMLVEAGKEILGWED